MSTADGFGRIYYMTFAQKVFQVVSKIPHGKVMTYAAVAKAAGRPRAYRAVGNVLNKNPRPIEIPCHRVVKSDGKVGGYVGGIYKKVRLLQQEGIPIYNNRIAIT